MSREILTIDGLEKRLQALYETLKDEGMATEEKMLLLNVFQAEALLFIAHRIEQLTMYG